MSHQPYLISVAWQGAGMGGRAMQGWGTRATMPGACTGHLHSTTTAATAGSGAGAGAGPGAGVGAGAGAGGCHPCGSSCQLLCQAWPGPPVAGPRQERAAVNERRVALAQGQVEQRPPLRLASLHTRALWRPAQGAGVRRTVTHGAAGSGVTGVRARRRLVSNAGTRTATWGCFADGRQCASIAHTTCASSW